MTTVGKTKTLNFITHAELKNVIGRDLINDDNIAVIELVKNSLDAKSKKVSVVFAGDVESAADEDRTGHIEIADWGIGMSLSDVEQKWLNIAYSEKRSVSQDGDRLLAGNKGVGRFACDRLGKQLDLYTFKQGSKPVHVRINWTDFEQLDGITDTIQSVKLSPKFLTVPEWCAATSRKSPTPGTFLKVTKLRSAWERQKLLGLKRYLQRFINPNAAFDKASFSLHLTVPSQRLADTTLPEHEKLNGPIINQVFDKLRFKTTYITSEIDATGQTLTTELHHEGARVYRVVEKNNQFALLANSKLVIHYLNQYRKAYFKRETGLDTVSFGSIFFFLNGYRVPPYGDRGNDWLRIDNRKLQGMSRYLGTRELVGRIEVVDHNQRFRVVSNREGVSQTPAFLQVIGKEISDGWFYRALKRLEKFVVTGLDWDRLSLEDQSLVNAEILPTTEAAERYFESLDTKRRRIAMDVLGMVDARVSDTMELAIDPNLFDALKREERVYVDAALAKLGKFDGVLDLGAKMAMGDLVKSFAKQEALLATAKNQAQQKSRQLERLKSVARGAIDKATVLEKKNATQAKELQFARRSRSRDADELMLLHHHTHIYADTAKNNLKSLSKALNAGEHAKAPELIAKLMKSIQRILAVSDFAMKVEFKQPLKTDQITADLAGFIEEFVQTVLKDGTASGMNVVVERVDQEPFKVRFKPFDITVLLDNLASNSDRAGSKVFHVEMERASPHELVVRIRDKGRGIHGSIAPTSAIFNLGVTTTMGSGMGLFHVKQIVEEMGGTVHYDEEYLAGFGITIRFFN
jgi:signal transduction histidine kinase